MTKSIHVITPLRGLCSCLFFCAFISLPIHASVEQENIDVPKTNVQVKFYQQALYYYFQGNYNGALDILYQSKLRLNSLVPSAQLFQAGLQIKIGLQEQARQNLLLLTSSQPPIEKVNKISVNNALKSDTNQKNYLANSNQLLVLALLSLTEQYIEQGALIQAQDTLAQITTISQRYYPQYHVLNQLAFWPEEPKLLSPELIDASKTTQNQNTEKNSPSDDSPYIQLNDALRFIEQGEFEQAITLLQQIKNRTKKTPELSFFQGLFFDEEGVILKKQNSALIYEQAIDDYARLLLAYLYSQQENYDKVYLELKSFPQQSPYTESALFLYAFSAQKINQHTIALTLLSLLHQQYPYSALGWQSSLLMAKQVAQQKGLEQGWQSFQAIELFYLNTIDELNAFEQSFLASEELLSFSTTTLSLAQRIESYFNTPTQTADNTELKGYEPESVWLQQALYDPSLNSLYKQLTEVTGLIQQSQLFQNKSDWLMETIHLNTLRKARISASQASLTQQDVFNKLLSKRDVVASKLNKALNDPLGLGFELATVQEQGWLQRLEQSKNTLSMIIANDHQNKQSMITNYQHRLNRVNGVLAWKLHQHFPDRAWQHKQQLAELDSDIEQVSALQVNVNDLLEESLDNQSTASLMPFRERQQAQEAKIKPLINNLTTLKGKLTLKIREKVSKYINEQRLTLSHYLLTTRKDMAALLEKMSVNDEKREKQLNLSDESGKGITP